MRLCIAEHLQPVFDAANGVIEDCQIARLLLADPLFISQRLKSRQGAGPADGGNAPARDQLQDMGKKLDLANAILAGFQVIAMPTGCLHWPAQHRLHIVHHRVIQRSPPDERLNVAKEAGAKCEIARDRSGPDEGRSLPGAGD